VSMGQAETTSIACPENLILLKETAYAESGNESDHQGSKGKIGMRGRTWLSRGPKRFVGEENANTHHI
jgi:hypothetical protein